MARYTRVKQKKKKTRNMVVNRSRLSCMAGSGFLVCLWPPNYFIYGPGWRANRMPKEPWNGGIEKKQERGVCIQRPFTGVA